MRQTCGIDVIVSVLQIYTFSPVAQFCYGFIKAFINRLNNLKIYGIVTCMIISKQSTLAT